MYFSPVTGAAAACLALRSARAPVIGLSTIRVCISFDICIAVCGHQCMYFIIYFFKLSTLFVPITYICQYRYGITLMVMKQLSYYYANSRE